MLPNIPSLAGHTDEFITLQLILLRERSASRRR